MQPTSAGLAPTVTAPDIVFSDSGDGVLAQVSERCGPSVGLGFAGQLDAPVVQGDTATYANDATTDVRVSVGVRPHVSVSAG